MDRELAIDSGLGIVVLGIVGAGPYGPSSSAVRSRRVVASLLVRTLSMTF